MQNAATAREQATHLWERSTVQRRFRADDVTEALIA